MKILIFLLTLILIPVVAFSSTEITYYGHAGFKIKTPTGKVLLVDPWITNPSNPDGKKQLDELERADLIFLTHAHADHIGNSVEIAKKFNTKLVATYDLGKAMVIHGGYPANLFGYDTTGNFGGEITLLDGEIRVLFVPALHSSGLEISNSSKSLIYGGNPGGFLITIKNGPTIYHTGDTDLFGDMKLLGELYKIDIMMVCIGDRFTMGPKRAAIAVKYVNPTVVIPMHYGTFPILPGKVEEFEDELKRQNLSVKIIKMKPGESIRY